MQIVISYFIVFRPKGYQQRVTRHWTIVQLVSDSVPCLPKGVVDIFRLFADFRRSGSSVHDPWHGTAIFARRVGLHVFDECAVHASVVNTLDACQRSVSPFFGHHSDVMPSHLRLSVVPFVNLVAHASGEIQILSFSMKIDFDVLVAN